ncbi:MAG: glycosyl hydrolase family 18 protein [Chloroflexota bacterium]|nr:glycosyl hydrolase family 18 protein [Chloroflexota bacterium]
MPAKEFLVHMRAGRLTRSLVTGVSALLLSAAALAITSSGRPEARAAADHLVLGYYVADDPASWMSLQAHADKIDLVAPQWVTVDACGSLGSSDDQTLKQFAQVRGVRVVPSLLTVSAWLNHRLLSDEQVTQHTIEQIVAYTVAEDYAGLDLDLEGVDAADRDALSTFVARAAVALHERGKLLTLAVPAKDRDVTIGWAGAYDYAALGADTDLVTIMAYDFRGPFSGPGSVAPIDWVDRVLRFAARQIPPDKLLLGLASYGYDWNLTSGGTRSLGYASALELAQRYAVDIGFDRMTQSATFNYTDVAGDRTDLRPPVEPLAHDVTSHIPTACAVAAPPRSTPTPTPTIEANTPQLHEVWLEDSASASARLDLAALHGVRGVASWRLGLEDERAWPAFEAFRAR